jgi:hypothetical protein
VAGPEPGLGVARAGFSTGTWPGQGADLDGFGRSRTKFLPGPCGNLHGGSSLMVPTRGFSTTCHPRHVIHDRPSATGIPRPVQAACRRDRGGQWTNGGNLPDVERRASSNLPALAIPTMIGEAMSRRPLRTTAAAISSSPLPSMVKAGHPSSSFWKGCWAASGCGDGDHPSGQRPATSSNQGCGRKASRCPSRPSRRPKPKRCTFWQSRRRPQPRWRRRSSTGFGRTGYPASDSGRQELA